MKAIEFVNIGMDEKSWVSSACFDLLYSGVS